jgi:tetratricopeptide (TPR) repeat protein
MNKIKFLLILLNFTLISFSQEKDNKNNLSKPNSELINWQKNEIEIEKLKSENIFLKETVKELKVDFDKNLEKQSETITDKLNLYIFFIGLILTLIAWAINFFGKAEIKRRVEEIIQATAETHAINKTNQVISEKITEEYTAKIIREKGEPEITKLLSELEEKGKKTINEIREKGDNIINSVWAAPPKTNAPISDTNNDVLIKKANENIRADEFFNLAFNTSDPKVRIELYKNVIEIEPKNYSALNNIGVAYNDIYKYEEAITNLNKAIELNENYALSYANRANSYNQLNDFPNSLKDAERAIELAPNLEWAYAIKGNVLTKQGNFVEAERTLNRAIEINQNSAVAYFNRGYFNEETKRYDESIKDYLKAEELGYDNLAYLYNNLAVAHRRKKLFDEAIEYINKARNIDPDWPNIDGTLALIYSDKGDEENFYKYLKIALDKGCLVWNFLSDYAFDPYRDTEKLKKLIEPYKKNHYA